MRPSWRRTAWAMAFLGAFPAAVRASDTAGVGSVRLQADHIEYLKDQGLVTATGRVRVTQDTTSLFADKVRYDVSAHEMEATGHVIFQQASMEIDAGRMTYNTQTATGDAEQARTTMPPWICTGAKIRFEQKKIVITGARATSCDYALDYTHYHLQAGTLTFYDDNTMTAENLVLYIGKVPVFYFPFFAMNTKSTQLPFSILVGESGYLGNYALVSTSYLLNPVNYGSLYADYFSNKGIGLGIRHEIALNNYSTLSLYGYRIQEKDTGDVRWESRIRGLWAVSSSLQGRVEADLPGDGFFSQDYAAARRDPSLVSTQREYDLSATYSRDPMTLGILIRHQETADPAAPRSGHFLESLDSVPQVNFNLFPQPLLGRNWIKADLSLNGDRTWTLANGFYVTHLNGTLGLSQSVPFLSSQTLYTRASLQDAYQDRSDAGVDDAGETRSFSLNNIYTARWSNYFDTTVSHTYTRKLDHFLPSDPPGGVTADLLTGNAEFIAGSFFRSNTSTSVDFTSQAGDLASKFSYLRQEIYLTPSSTVDFYNILDYSIRADALKDLNTRLSLTSPRRFWQLVLGANVVDPNVSNTGYVSSGVPKSFGVSGELDIALFTNYRVSLLETYDMTNARMEARNISIYRDLHDWEAQLSFSQVQGQPDTVFFTLDLKAFPGRPLTISENELQRLDSLQSQTAVQLLQTTSDQLR